MHDETAALWATLADQLADPESYWALGGFGAIAEFSRDADEAAVLDLAGPVLSVVTPRGGVRVTPHPGLCAVAYETPAGLGWNQTLALCLPDQAAPLHRRDVLTELGPDPDALRAEDRSAALFDLGLRVAHVDVCIRVKDNAAAVALREFTGRDVFAPGNPAMMTILAANPHRVFASHCARIEVYQPIPPHDGRSPEGPHTHVLPKLLAHGRTHAATDPIPDGLMPCLSLFPSHPSKDTLGRARKFQTSRHDAFQRLLRSYGDPAAIRLKERVIASVAAGQTLPRIEHADDEERLARAGVRIALRQFQAAGNTSPSLKAWLDKYERPGAHDGGHSSGDPLDHH